MAQFIHSKWQPDQTLWYFLCTEKSKTSLPACWFVTCCKTASCRGNSEHSNEPGRGEAIEMWKQDKSKGIVFIILIICFAEQCKSSFLAGKSYSIKTLCKHQHLGVCMTCGQNGAPVTSNGMGGIAEKCCFVLIFLGLPPWPFSRKKWRPWCCKCILGDRGNNF